MVANWRPLVAAAGVLCVGMALYDVLGQDGYFRLRERQRQVQKLREEVKRLSDENQRLEKQVQRLRSDPAAIERIAREEMKLVRRDEVIYTLPAPPPKPGEK